MLAGSVLSIFAAFMTGSHLFAFRERAAPSQRSVKHGGQGMNPFVVSPTGLVDHLYSSRRHFRRDVFCRHPIELMARRDRPGKYRLPMFVSADSYFGIFAYRGSGTPGSFLHMLIQSERVHEALAGVAIWRWD